MFSERTVVITGGSSGIGEALAKEFITLGARVIVLDITTPSYEVEFKPVRVEVEEEVKQAFSGIEHIDLLICNAGIKITTSLQDLQLSDYDRILAINVRGTLLCMKYALAALQQAKGQVITMSSTLAHLPSPDNFLYAMTKSALITLTKAFAQDYQTTGVRYNAVLPGPVKYTNLNHITDENSCEQAKLRCVPLGRCAEMHEIVQTVYSHCHY